MFWALGVAASFMLAAAFGALWYATRADLAATRENVARLETMVKERDRQISLTSQEISWLKDPRVQVALLKGLEGNPAARAKLLWNPGTKQGILWVSGLPPLPLEKSYELWAFVGDQPVPAGTFDAKSDAATVIPDLEAGVVRREAREVRRLRRAEGRRPRPHGRHRPRRREILKAASVNADPTFGVCSTGRIKKPPGGLNKCHLNPFKRRSSAPLP